MNDRKLYVAALSGCVAGIYDTVGWKQVGEISNEFASYLDKLCIVNNLDEKEETLIYDISKAVWEGNKREIINKISIYNACFIVKILYKKIIEKIK